MRTGKSLLVKDQGHIVAVEPLERDQAEGLLWNHWKESQGQRVAMEPLERGEVVWWLWNHR